MRIPTTLTSIGLTLALTTTPALAQSTQHVASASMMRQALATQAKADHQTRDVVRRVLMHDQVREVARHLGLNVVTAEAAVGTLTSAELARLAEPSRAAEAALAGGQSTVVISTTTLLLIIIIVILLAD
jgi:cytochrome c-type biogenesis protein CcmH/NrfG